MVNRKVKNRRGRIKKRKNVSKKLKENKIVRKKSVSKKTKKRIIKKSRRVNKKHGFFVSFFGAIKDWMKLGMKRIRKEQRHCLRFKKYKGKQTFCFVRALSLEYPWRTIIGFTAVGIIGSFIFADNLQKELGGDYLNFNLQTSLVSKLESKVKSINSKILDRQKCTQDKYWMESEDDVCNYWLYEQKNEHCSKFNVPTNRVAIGKKMCCEQLDGIFYTGSKQNVVACPGADIFFNKSAMHSTSIVSSAMECSTNVCQFYPKNGFHVKLGDDGRIIIEKDCPVSQTVGSCDKECGGGKRLRTINTASCIKVEQYELCNVEPCFAETVVN